MSKFNRPTLNIISILCVATLNGTPVAVEASTLTTEDQTALKALGVAIAVPAEVPAGYTVSQVKLKPCPAESSRSPKGTCRFGPEYTIVYRNAAKDSCFAIEAVGGGVGGPTFEYRMPFRTALLGDVALNFGKPDGSNKLPSDAQLNSPQSGLQTDWGSEDGGKSEPFYRLVGADLIKGAECRNTITPNEAIKVVQSLTLLK